MDSEEKRLQNQSQASHMATRRATMDTEEKVACREQDTKQKAVERIVDLPRATFLNKSVDVITEDHLKNFEDDFERFFVA